MNTLAAVVAGFGSGGWFVGIGSGSGFCGVGAICSLAQEILYIINGVLIPVLFAVAFLVFLYGVAKAYIFNHGDTKGIAEGHKYVLWGIIGFVIMLSVWGLVNVVSNTFGLAGWGAPLPPTSYPY